MMRVVANEDSCLIHCINVLNMPVMYFYIESHLHVCTVVNSQYEMHVNEEISGKRNFGSQN